MKKWYTLHTKPNSEYRVASLLQQRDIETYLPELCQQHKRMPLFPCYLFVRVDLEKVTPSQWQWTPGLRRIVSFGRRPVSLADEIINLIRRKVDESKSADLSTNRFRPGETVRIKSGPLEGMLAIFDSATKPSQRVQVLLTILGGANRVRIDAANLEKVLHRSEVTEANQPRRTRGRGRSVR